MDLSQALSSPAASYVVAIPAIVLCAIVLVGIGLAVTRIPRPQIIRRHSGTDTYWSVQPEQLTRAEGVLTVEHRPKHSRIIDDVYDAIGNDDTIILDGTIETWESYGRRSADSPVRHQPVPSDWMPPVGNVLIKILSTPTAEYLFARKPKDQLQPRLVRPYMMADLVG